MLLYFKLYLKLRGKTLYWGNEKPVLKVIHVTINICGSHALPAYKDALI